jgi:heat-inducible transcriptional repressor
LQELSRRQQQVLQLAVRHYVDTMEPVGSKTLVRRFDLPASPATVRSAMGVLEQRGLLTQPHTSAGRIPSQQGYRLYVDQLLPEPCNCSGSSPASACSGPPSTTCYCNWPAAWRTSPVCSA